MTVRWVSPETDEVTFKEQCHVLEDALNHKKAWSYVVDKPGYHFEATVEVAGDAS